MLLKTALTVASLGSVFSQDPNGEPVPENNQPLFFPQSEPIAESSSGNIIIDPAPENLSDHHSQDPNQDPTYLDDLANGRCVDGKPIIDKIEYTTDGNYKMEIKIYASQDLHFKNFRADKCSHNTPGVAFINYPSKEVTVQINLALCKLRCDTQHLTSSIEFLNSPIGISFELCDNGDPNSPVISRYELFPHTAYFEDYINDWHVPSGQTSQIVVDANGHAGIVPDNLQWSYMTFTDESFTTKTFTSKMPGAPGQYTYWEICPVNGFTPGSMVVVPEMCFLKDLDTNEMALLWDMQAQDYHCVSNLLYKPATGIWQLPSNFYKIMNKAVPSDPNDGQLHNNFMVTCNMRVCGNIVGNPCQARIDSCDYQE